MVSWSYLPLSTLPAPYELVWCRFPVHESLGNPGPKPRPALVRNAAVDSEGRGEIEVVYGTTNLKLNTRPFDFVICKASEMDQCGLYRATRFDLDKVVWIPWATEWVETPADYPSPVIGKLTDEAIRMLQICWSFKVKAEADKPTD